GSDFAIACRCFAARSAVPSFCSRKNVSLIAERSPVAWLSDGSPQLSNVRNNIQAIFITSPQKFVDVDPRPAWVFDVSSCAPGSTTSFRNQVMVKQSFVDVVLQYLSVKFCTCVSESIRSPL